MSRTALGLLLLLAPACRPGSGAGPLRLGVSAAGPDTRLTLIAARGLQVNARVKPALELPDGTVLRFDSPHLTADSAYFTQPPTALLPGAGRQPAGTLRASVCAADELVCRSVTLEL